MSARRSTQPGRGEQLMTWRAPRISRRAHVMLLIVVTAILLAGGTALVAGIITDDLTALVSVMVWGWTCGCGALSYASGVIYR